MNQKDVEELFEEVTNKMSGNKKPTKQDIMSNIVQSQQKALVEDYEEVFDMVLKKWLSSGGIPSDEEINRMDILAKKIANRKMLTGAEVQERYHEWARENLGEAAQEIYFTDPDIQALFKSNGFPI